MILHRPIERQNLASHRGESGTAAADATLYGLDERLPETSVHGLGKNPSATVAHAHAPPRGGNRSGFPDRL